MIHITNREAHAFKEGCIDECCEAIEVSRETRLLFLELVKSEGGTN